MASQVPGCRHMAGGSKSSAFKYAIRGPDLYHQGMNHVTACHGKNVPWESRGRTGGIPMWMFTGRFMEILWEF